LDSVCIDYGLIEFAAQSAKFAGERAKAGALLLTAGDGNLNRCERVFGQA
jgi:hypothetical protein